MPTATTAKNALLLLLAFAVAEEAAEEGREERTLLQLQRQGTRDAM